MVAPYTLIRGSGPDIGTGICIPVTNPLERVNKEIKRRTNVVGIFPKVWLSTRPDRRPHKAARDKVQAVIAALIAEAYLGLSFDDPTLTALPSGLIEGIEAIRSDIDRAHSELPSGGL